MPEVEEDSPADRTPDPTPPYLAAENLVGEMADQALARCIAEDHTLEDETDG